MSSSLYGVPHGTPDKIPEYMPTTEFNLMNGIVELSEANNWQQAKKEWRVEFITKVDDPYTCLCGHNPIKELCFLENIKNGKKTMVGNVCVKKFVDKDDDDNELTQVAAVFTSLKRIVKDITRSFSEQAIEFAYTMGWVDDWQYDFYMDTRLKRKLTRNQLNKRVEVNRIIIEQCTRKPEPLEDDEYALAFLNSPEARVFEKHYCYN